MDVRDVYALIDREYRATGTTDPVTLAMNGFYWVMNLDAYKQVRAACAAAGAVYPEGDDPDAWVPKPEDRLYGLLVDVRDDGGEPHLERSGNGVVVTG